MSAAVPKQEFALTPEQRAIVEHGDGPVVVIAGAGTGKTRVIVERVRWLLETEPDLQPESLLVLTYNVKAARELRERIQERIGPAKAARLSVSNFHSFCHRVLRESASEAGMPPNPDVLDGVGQLLLIKELRPSLDLLYHGDWSYADFVKFINRAKDELVTPDDFDAFVAGERGAFENRYGPYADAAASLLTNGNLKPVREVRKAYARSRTDERAGAEADPEVEKSADREARRTVSGIGRALYRHEIPEERHPEIDELADTYVRDGAALEVMRLAEIASVYRAYQEELASRGALDFGEQIAAVTQLFKARPNILRRWQQQFRHILVDEFQDANQDLYHAREPNELGVVMPESPPIFHLNEDRRSTQAIHGFASHWAAPSVADAPRPVAVGPKGRRVEVFTYTDGNAEACRKVLGTALRRIIDAGKVAPSDVVVLTPRSNRSSWLMAAAPVEAWPYRLMPEYGLEGAVLPVPTKGNEVRVATIHRYKGLEAPVVVLAEIDGRIDEAELASLLYVGAMRARSHLLVIASDVMSARLAQ